MAGRRRVELVLVRRRLELLLKALHGRDFEIVADRQPAIRWWERFFADARSRARSPEAVPEIVAGRVALPLELRELPDAAPAADRYRLMALAGAERIARGGLDAHAAGATPLERELIWLREGALADAAVVARVPSLEAALVRARARILARRPPTGLLTPREQAVEALIQRVLHASPAHVPPELEGDLTPEGSVEWARRVAATVEQRPGEFTGTAPVGHWGACPREPVAYPDSNPMILEAPFRLGAVDVRTEGTEGQASHEPADDRDAPRPADDDAEGAQRDADAGIGDAYDDARRTPRRTGTPFRYAEWDGDHHRYLPDAVTVWTEVARSGAHEAEADPHPVATRRLRSQFAQLRVQRATRRRELSGDALDLASLIEAIVDRRMGRTPDERVYESARVNRRPLAIAVLVDVSGSTANQLEDGARIIDLEKDALRMAHDALDALGDPYGLFAFAGLGAQDVQVFTIKGFQERSAVAPARIRALQPDQNTRLGAAIRHVARVLASQRAGHQLLLVITDGRPNDVAYHERYAVADSRRAVLDAQNRGATVFALAIDFEDHEYLAAIFGPSGYVYVRNPHALGRQLLRSIASMLRG